uniref:Uncharacterized protein n=1 Tax=Plectus sambesii TaxID=2011161 RepID=A0A914XBL0_9BILA
MGVFSVLIYGIIFGLRCQKPSTLASASSVPSLAPGTRPKTVFATLLTPHLEDKMTAKQHQQQPDTMATVRSVFHGLCAAFFGYTLFYDVRRGGTAPIPGVFLSRLVWLTTVDLYLQILYHSVATIASLQNRTSLLNRVVDFLFTSLAMPIALTVVSLFWGLTLINPDLLMDEEAKIVLSVQWYNHALHTIPGVAMLMDVYITKHKRPNHYAAFATIVVVSTCYLAFILYIHSVTGYWAYPILGDLGLAGRTAFIAGCALVIFSLFLLSDMLNGKTWVEKVLRSSQMPAALKNRKPKKA